MIDFSKNEQYRETKVLLLQRVKISIVYRVYKLKR